MLAEPLQFRKQNGSPGCRFLSRFNKPRLLHAIRNSTLGQIVRRHFHFHFVAGKNTDVILAHAAGNMGGDGMAILELHSEGGVRQGIHHRAFKFYGIVF